jgi:hypothetical protein
MSEQTGGCQDDRPGRPTSGQAEGAKIAWCPHSGAGPSRAPLRPIGHVPTRVRLLVAAGGGGDAVAAAMLARARWPGDAVHVLTYAWDRVAVDPRPGPRGARDFDGLERIGRRNWRVHATTTACPPGCSLLPRVASLGPALYLIDPDAGPAGLRCQIDDLAATVNADYIGIVDVGGDILGRTGDPQVSSPLCEAVVLAAVPAAAAVWVLGPGSDGELPGATVADRARLYGGTVHRLDGSAVRSFADVFTWHPSEASGVTWAATQGARGVVEVRAAGHQVTVDESTATVWEVGAGATRAASLASTVADASSLHAAHVVLVGLGLPTELSAAQAALRAAGSSPGEAPTAAAVEVAAGAARKRGADLVTLGRFARLVGTTRPLLVDSYAGHPAMRPPFWVLNPTAWPEVASRRAPSTAPDRA